MRGVRDFSLSALARKRATGKTGHPPPYEGYDGKSVSTRRIMRGTHFLSRVGRYRKFLFIKKNKQRSISVKKKSLHPKWMTIMGKYNGGYLAPIDAKILKFIWKWKLATAAVLF